MYNSSVSNFFTSRKCYDIDWLSDIHIPFSDQMCRPELYSLIKLHLERITDDISEQTAVNLQRISDSSSEEEEEDDGELSRI